MKPYYEGWYMKQQQGEDVLAVIPGRAQDSAFIQVVSNRGSRFLPYPLEAFDRTDGSMRIGDSLFTPYGMQLRIDEPDFELVEAFATIICCRCARTSWGRSPTCPWKRSIPCSACGTR